MIGVVAAATVVAAVLAGPRAAVAAKERGEAPAAAATSPSSVRSQIEAAYARISGAFHREDVQAIMSETTSDFSALARGQTLDRAAAQATLQQNFDTITSVQADRYTINRVTMRGPTVADVDVTERSLVTFMDSRGEFGALGKTHKIAARTVYRDTWVQQPDGAWKMKRSQMRSTSITIDGRRYRPTRARPIQPSRTRPSQR
jgi:ketosteroid isomerase-like protein